jgi:ABC-type multidrug transport system ATPase subunit/pSer/pThr/pTyr-binding forkhead associated (FHA) protein
MNAVHEHVTPAIKFFTGPLAGKTYQLTKGVINLGRALDNDIIIPDGAVSRYHAQIIRRGDEWYIKKNSPQAMLIINQRGTWEAPLMDSNTICLGYSMTSFCFQTNVTDNRQTIPMPQQVSAMLPDLFTPYSLSVADASQNNTASTVLTPPAIIQQSPVVAELVSSMQQPPVIAESVSSTLKPTRNLVNYGDTEMIPAFGSDLLSDNNKNGTATTEKDGRRDTQEPLPEIRPIPLTDSVTTIGRAPDNVVVLNHPQISGHHARIHQTSTGHCIIDHGSTNHVYVNAQRVTRWDLIPGDEIRIGPFKLTYTGTELLPQDESQSIRIDALGLYKESNKGVVLLNDISLSIPPRKFVAVVGGSGAGKTTLLDALYGLRPVQQGIVYYNGKNYYRHMVAFSTQLGYVPQDDIVHCDLTVERVLYYAARLRLPSDFTRKQIKERIDAVLEDVEIAERRKLLVSKLSGGQRKRVSIALELLASPSVFFLDEPTSGLDPGLDSKMMQLLRKLADKGRTIILVTHATNNIDVCDYICFLAPGGRLAYYGPPEEAKTYFGKQNFADIYSSLEPTRENPDVPAQAEARFRQSPEFMRYVLVPLNTRSLAPSVAREQTSMPKRPKHGNSWLQFRTLVTRYLELLKNDLPNLLILLLQAPIIGLILFFLASGNTFNETGILSCPHHVNLMTNSGPTSNDCQQEFQSLQELNNTPAGRAFKMRQFPGKSDLQILQDAIAPVSGSSSQKILLIIVLAAVMSGCTNGAREIVKEMPIYRRERTVNLGIIPYMLSKISVLGTLCLLQSLILVLLVNAKAPFTHSILLPPLLEIYISTALASLSGLMIGLTISAVVPNSDRALSFVPIVLVPQIIFSNVLFSLDNPPALQYIGGIFPARWAMAAMGSTVGLHGDKLRTDGFSYRGMLLSLYSQSEAIFHLLLCWALLVLIILVLSITIGVLLKKKDIRA